MPLLAKYAFGALPFEEPTRELDLSQIREELRPLLELKGEPEALARLEQKIATIDRRVRGGQP